MHYLNLVGCFLASAGSVVDFNSGNYGWASFNFALAVVNGIIFFGLGE